VGEHLPPGPTPDELRLPLDDLDLLLLDLAVDFPISLNWFSLADVGSALNHEIPNHTSDELALALTELFALGDAMASIRQRSSRRRSKAFLPTLDEIDAGLRGSFELVYELTPSGGARWEKVVRPDWSLYLSSSEGQRFSWTQAQSRGYLEYWIEVERSLGRIGELSHWKELRPWRPVYWKQLPVGYEAKCTLTKEESRTPQGPWTFPLPPWGLGFTPEFHRGPSGLAPRKERRTVRDLVGEPTSVFLDTLPKRLRSVKDARTCFAEACDCAPGMTPKALLELFRLRHGEARFAAVREFARRRHSGAVSELLALVLREQYLPALWALGEIADQRALPVLDNLLEHGGTGNIAQDSPWHGILVRALARYGDAVLSILEKSLAAKTYPATSLAIRALGLIGSAASHRMLEQERAKACAAGGPCWEIDNALGRPSNRRTPEKLAKERLLRATHVVKGKYEAVPLADPIQMLVETLNHPDCARRRAAVDLLVEFGSRDRSADIGRLAKDPEWEVRASVAYALRQFDVSPEVLATLAKDRNPAVRWLAKKRLIPSCTT
jgi:hypothetical protein